MREIARTLDAMTLRERSDLMASVAIALEAAAEKAQAVGNDSFAANSLSLARMIDGCARDVVVNNLPAAELLLQHGIALLALFEGGAPQPTLH